MTKILSAVTSTDWAIEESKFAQIHEFLSRAYAGEVLAEDEVAEVVEGAHGRQQSEEIAMMLPDGRSRGNQPPTFGGVRVLSIYGTIANRMDMFMAFSGGTSTIRVENEIAEALRDDEVKSILIDVDSPGGITLGTAELATMIFEAREKKPIYVIARGLMASAAYWIGSAATKVYATESSLVGSIGVIQMHVDRSKQNEEAGLTVSVLRIPESKADMQPVEPLSEKAKANAMARLSSMYQQFVLAVARNRNVDASTVEADFGGGRVMLAAQAAKIGMIDGVRTFSSVLSELQSTQQTQRKETFSMNAQVKNALLACQLISSIDATDEVCDQEVAKFYNIKGQTKPNDDETIRVDLLRHAAGVTAGTTSDSGASNGPTAADALAADRERRRELIAMGEELGIDQAVVAAACDDLNATVASVRPEWKKLVGNSAKPLTPIRPTGDALDRIVAGATAGIMYSQGMIEANELGEHGRDFASASLPNIARAYLSAANVDIGLNANNEDIAKAFLRTQSGTSEELTLTETRDGFVGAAGVPFAAPGRYPALLDNLAFKIFAKSMEITPTTYRRWCGRIDSVPDLELHSIYGSGEFPLMSQREDKQKSKEITFSEEVNFVQADEYGAHATLTPRMIAADQRGFFQKKLMKLQTAHDLTLNQLMVNMLVAQITLPWSNQVLFHGDHANVVAAGAAPSITEISKMRKAMRKQKTVDGEHSARLPMNWLLVPSDMETEAEQVCLSLPTQVAEDIAGKNVFAGKIDPITEPELDQFSTIQYYGGTDPNVCPALVYCFMQGYESGRIVRWFDPATGCWTWEIQGRFGAAIENHRPIIRNAGTGA
jgi:signal peptide peptidase SppA